MADLLVTSSNILAAWRLISVCALYPTIRIDEAIEIVRDSGMVGGALPAHEGFTLAKQCKLVELDAEQGLRLTEYSNVHLVGFCMTEEPNTHIIRCILHKYLSAKSVDWLLFFDEDPEVFKAAIPTDWIQLLEYGQLFNYEEDLVREWWSNIFRRFQTYKEGKKLELGKVAEKLTLDFERKRLMSDGYPSDHTSVKWASQMSDKFGYDILSIRGRGFKFSYDEKDKIQIEVKSSVLDNTLAFRFFITKNEWTKAKDNIESYFFYCWASAKIETQSAIGPFVISAKDIESHIPMDIGSPVCEWSECRLVVDLHSRSLCAPFLC
jgi:hypothetical protein